MLQSLIKELCHGISVLLLTEAGWGSSFFNQVRGQSGFGGVMITPLARAVLACTLDGACTLALASEINIVRMQKDQLTSLF